MRRCVTPVMSHNKQRCSSHKHQESGGRSEPLSCREREEDRSSGACSPSGDHNPAYRLLRWPRCRQILLCKTGNVSYVALILPAVKAPFQVVLQLQMLICGQFAGVVEKNSLLC